MDANDLFWALERIFADGARIREQRRYEIARDVIAARSRSDEGTIEGDVFYAVRAADLLLEALDPKGEEARTK